MAGTHASWCEAGQGYAAGHAAGVAAERARITAVIEAHVSVGCKMFGDAFEGSMADLLDKVQQP